MNETKNGTMGQKVPAEINYVRNMPDAKVHKVGEHYIVTAGCRTGVFHTPGGVGEFLHQLLAEWIENELADPRRILGLAGMDRIRPTREWAKCAEGLPERR